MKRVQTTDTRSAIPTRSRVRVLASCWAMPVIVGVAFELWLSPSPRMFAGMFSLSVAAFPVVRVAALSATTIAGIVCGFLFGAPARQARRVRGRRASLALDMTSRRTPLAALVSPIVFYSIYTATEAQPDALDALFFAFTNGYFWETIIARRALDSRPAGEPA